jgi:hypothetical protein
MNWSLPSIELRPVLGATVSRPSWPLGSHEITEEDGEDGGTFYRPEAPTWHNGTSDPSATTGDEGDYFLRTDNRTWFGPKGEENESGEGNWPGPYSLPSGTWSNGTGDPADGTGGNGDYYLDTSARAWWGPKAGGTWADTGPHHIAAGWVDIVNGPVASGLFSVPGCEIANGDPAEAAAQDAACSLELSDADGARIALIPIADLSADGGRATGSHSTSRLVELEKTQTIARARWIITGGVMLTWSASGSIAKLK